MQKSIFFIFNDFWRSAGQNFFNYGLTFSIDFFLIVRCENKANQPAQCFAIVIFLYLKWSSNVVQGKCLCNSRDKNVDLHNFFISVKMIYLIRLPKRRSYMLKKCTAHWKIFSMFSARCRDTVWAMPRVVYWLFIHTFFRKASWK